MRFDPIRRTIIGIWERTPWEKIGSALAIPVGIAVFATLIYSERGYEIVKQEHEEGRFARDQGAVSLAWHTLNDTRGITYEIGQSAAFNYIAGHGSFFNNINLNRTTLHIDVPESMTILSLSDSRFCEASIDIISAPLLVMSRSNFTRSTLRGNWNGVNLFESNFSEAILDGIISTSLDLTGANLQSVRIVGGVFHFADFRGADLRKLKTVTGRYGAQSRREDSATDMPKDNYYGGVELLPYGEFRSAVFDKSLTDQQVASEYVEGNSQESDIVDFRGSLFDHADLRGADLKNSNIGQSQIDAACADDTTQLPPLRTIREKCVGEAQAWVQNCRELLRSRTMECESAAASTNTLR